MRILHYIPALSRRLGGVAMYMQFLTKELGKQCELIEGIQEGREASIIEGPCSKA